MSSFSKFYNTMEYFIIENCILNSISGFNMGIRPPTRNVVFGVFL